MSKRKYRFGIEYLQRIVDKWNRQNKKRKIELILVPASEYFLGGNNE